MPHRQVAVKNQSGRMKQQTHDIQPQCKGDRIGALMRTKFIFKHPQMSAFVR
jgi:hypothetical protein